MTLNVNTYFSQTTKAAPLAAFRIFFGLMMFASIVRFWSYGWIDKLYIQPKFFFSYYGFEFVQPLGSWTYLLFAVCGLSALLVMVGYQYRMAIVTFFLSFTYIELMDKTTYLNHYYFISILSFLMIFLPANRYFSVDAKRNDLLASEYIPNWSIDAIKLLLVIVYFYAGLAKLNSDWLLEGMPLKIWLPSKYDLPFLGDLLQKQWVIYAFSWGGAIYDLAIPFLLLHRPTRVFAFVLVVIFHVLTRVLFPIGMFPYIMIVSATIFFDANFHNQVLQRLASWFKINKARFDNGKVLVQNWAGKHRLKLGLLTLFFVLQLAFPFRHLAYPGELFWHEQGYRFSWRVMLMEKAGYAQFKVVDGVSGQQFYVDNTDFLSAFQEKQMATQPDFILQYAHFLKEHFEQQGHENVEVYVESYVALNGRRSRPYIDPEVNLVPEEESFKNKNWILPFEDDIKGL
ncbi:HTTM domain-containing protein [Fulvivirga sp. RKSG066]|uniref:HTTM domain-containing protein n=1 Tax=Fulvivirga aurantia TaxID=2529383 RepID=UPI0012BD4DB3|nr:HTTM domain-containing protein [Fulvivirga aurantia]MTI21062.1 HTTM domain-containing protein [Fulvivirga aurantia]